MAVRYPIIALVLMIILATGCTNKRSNELEKIGALESEIFAGEAGMIDQVKADELVRAYLAFAEKYTKDTLSPAYIYSAGDLMMNLDNPSGAIAAFQRLRRDYPDHAKADEALFLEAYVTENNLGDLGKAKDLYQEYLQLYPNEDFADDAQACIHNLGKSPEEIIREFEARQQASGDTVVEPNHSAL